MKKVLEGIEKVVVHAAYQERQKRALERYRKEKARLLQMSEDELNMEFINTKCVYEHKKNWLTVILVSILISILTSAWKSFVSFIVSALQYLMSDQNVELYKVSFVLCAILILFLTFAVIWILITYFRELKRLNRKILLIEHVRKERGIT